MKVFETFKTKNKVLEKYISYYYLDIADDDNYWNEYICYPHYNNTISLYKSHDVHFDNQHSLITFKKNVNPLQIFTPLREQTLKVIQKGPVHKIGIVFEPFAINHFLVDEVEISKRVSSPDFKFFEDDFTCELFKIDGLGNLIDLLDQKLLDMLFPFENIYIEKALQLFHSSTDEFSINELAEMKLGISRKQLNRLFQKCIGTTPQKYRTILRFRQLMNYKLKNLDQQNLTSLSHQAHYTDQSHFIKACRQLTGLTPSQFFKEGKIVGTEDTFWNFTS